MGRTLALLFELGYDLTREWLDERKRRKQAQQRWAQTPAPVRGCRACGNVAYIANQTRCYTCGAAL